MLKMLLRQEIDRRRIGVRAAAKEIGISHSTVYAVFNDRPLEVDTAYLICKWLGVPLTSAVDQPEYTPDAAVAAIRLLLKAAPDLEKVFISAIDALKEGDLTPEDFQDVVEFAAYKIQRKRQLTTEAKNDQPNEAENPSPA